MEAGKKWKGREGKEEKKQNSEASCRDNLLIVIKPNVFPSGILYREYHININHESRTSYYLKILFARRMSS
jgi:hypothetical protein